VDFTTVGVGRSTASPLTDRQAAAAAAAALDGRLNRCVPSFALSFSSLVTCTFELDDQSRGLCDRARVVKEVINTVWLNFN